MADDTIGGLKLVHAETDADTDRSLRETEEEIKRSIRKSEEYLAQVRSIRSKFVSPAIQAEQVYEKILTKRASGERGIATGIDWWDSWAGPFRRGNVYVIAGYPGSGKTTLALQLAWAMAKRGRRPWFYCLELMSDEVFEVLAGHIRGNAVVSPEDETLAYAEIQSTGFRFYEPSGYKPWDERLEEVCATTRKEQIDFIVIDNLGFLTRSIKNAYEVENVASARIKSLAQELEVPILVLHHLRKPDSDSQEPEPNAHAMKGSGAILADASDAFILHHPLQDEEGAGSRHQVGYLLSGKPRWGMGGKKYVRLEGAKRKYSEAFASEYCANKQKERGFRR